MINILAQLTETASTIVAAAAGLTTGGILSGVAIKHITNRKIHLNGKTYVTQDLCNARKESSDERHDDLKDDIQEIKRDVKSLLSQNCPKQ